MEVDISLWKQVLTWIITGPGSGAITFWLMEQFAGDLRSDIKRYISLLLPGALAALFYIVFAVAFSYAEVPVGWKSWFETLFAVAAMAITTAQTIHGAKKLRPS